MWNGTLFKSEDFIDISGSFALTENIVDFAKYTLQSVNRLCDSGVYKVIVIDVLLFEVFHL